MSKLPHVTCIVQVIRQGGSATCSFEVRNYSEATANIIPWLAREGWFGDDPESAFELARDQPTSAAGLCLRECDMLEWTLHGFTRGYFRAFLGNQESFASLVFQGAYVVAKVAICVTLDDLIGSYRNWGLRHLETGDDDSREFWSPDEAASQNQCNQPSTEALLGSMRGETEFQPIETIHAAALRGAVASGRSNLVEARSPEVISLAEYPDSIPVGIASDIPWEMLPFKFGFDVAALVSESDKHAQKG